MYKISFVILHYFDIETTINCVESIKKYEKFNIVIVDNGSCNNSGQELKEKYIFEENIEVLLLEKNLGFANANNKGYKYAKEILRSDFIIVTNNDTIFIQEDFIEKLIYIFQRTQCYLLGPDIITPSGIHQNPHRSKRLSAKEVKKNIIIKSIFLEYYRLKKRFRLDNIMILEEMFAKKEKKSYINRLFEREAENVVLQGACLVYTPLFVNKQNLAFSESTFMYGEEDLLSFFCFRKAYKMLYTPELKVYHINGETTKKVYGNIVEKNIFTYKNIIQGYKLLLNAMKKG